MCGSTHRHTALYLEVEGLDGLPILVISKCAKKRPFLLQIFIEALQKSTQGGVRGTTSLSHHGVFLQFQTAMLKGQDSLALSFKPFTARATSV